MPRIEIVTPARAGTRTGNLHTAQRWAGFLRASGHQVTVGTEWGGRHCDLLIALHALRSHGSVMAYRQAHPGGPLVVVLTGTDLYRDLPDSRRARMSLALADRLVVLQPEGVKLLPQALRRRTRVIYQSSDTASSHAPPRDRFRIAVVGHLRHEKDPFRAALALAHLDAAEIEIVQVGGALAPGSAAEAKSFQRKDSRYRWLGSLPHGKALSWMARSHVLVVSSRMEGGANVICEAARIGTPVLASRMSGNVGMLGERYPGYYRLEDEKALARLIRKSMQPEFLQALKASLRRRRNLFAPSAERAGVARVAREALA
jgi:putative glycosyltransferase (TIGR04348 family)